jgi:hypothetical protein
MKSRPGTFLCREGQRGVAAATASVDYMFTLSRLQHVYGRTRLNQAVQRLLKLCAGLTGSHSKIRFVRRLKKPPKFET